MRMWGVRPAMLCNQHLLGEHVEMHMFIGALRKGSSIEGFIKRGLVEVHRIPERHFHLSQEMLRRGMRHRSPLDLTGVVLWRAGFITPSARHDLRTRCAACAQRMRKQE